MISMKTIKIYSPATVANLVCGYDILGMALNGPGDEMELSLSEEPGIMIRHLDGYGLPTIPSKNVAGVSLLALLDSYPGKTGFSLVVNKKIKPGSGLGSSAASAAGAVVAANHLLNDHFSREELVQFAMNGEKLASGVMHADNIAPCIYGGVTLIRSLNPLDIIPLNAPALFITVIHPQIEVKTSDARQILRKEIPLKDAVRQWANIAGLVTGLLKSDYELISRSLEDGIIEPVRSILIPGFDLLKKSCKEAGALGGGISGSGPSVFMLSRDESTAKNVEQAMIEVYQRVGLDFQTYVTMVNEEGVKIIG